MNKAANKKIIDNLNWLVKKDERILSYNKNLLEELEEILVERSKLKQTKSSDILLKIDEIESLIFGTKKTVKLTRRIKELVKKIRISKRKIYNYFDTTSRIRKKKVESIFSKRTLEQSEKKLPGVIALQKKLGLGLHDKIKRHRYSPHLKLNEISEYLKAVTTVSPSRIERFFKKSFWHIQIIKWKLLGYLKISDETLSIGPRWLTEILYFREVIGLKKHIGLDLFSDDSRIVVEGDMHRSPFRQNKFQFIFLKNVVDKSYNCRLLVKELIRIVKPGGIIAIDQICGYGSCTPLTRTDIQKGENILNLFRSLTNTKVLYLKNIDISGIGDAKEGNEKRLNVRLALRIFK